MNNFNIDKPYTFINNNIDMVDVCFTLKYIEDHFPTRSFMFSLLTGRNQFN